MAPLLGYWDVRGISSPIKLLLHHVNEPYEFKGYNFMENADEWFEKDKLRLGETLDFPNLPYFIDGNVKLSQSKVILAYLGRKYKLDAESESEKIRLGLTIEFLEDMDQSLVHIAYVPMTVANRGEVHETLRSEYEATLPDKLNRFSKFLGTNAWVAGDRLTYADFFAYDILDWNRVLFNPKHVNAENSICDYLERFENLEGVAEFLKSPDFFRLPIFAPAPFALFGNLKDYKPK